MIQLYNLFFNMEKKMLHIVRDDFPCKWKSHPILPILSANKRKLSVNLFSTSFVRGFTARATFSNKIFCLSGMSLTLQESI